MRKRKPDTGAMLAEAHAGLADIDRRQAELNEKRLDIDPAEAVKMDLAFSAARTDAERRIEQLNKRAAEELCARQKKAQLALIGRVEDKLAERDKHIGKMCEGLADVIKEMKLAIAANGAAAVAWPWEALHAEPCLFGLFLRVSIRHELYRLSGNPYESATNRGGFDFPGAECPTPLRDLRPESVRPLVEKAREASEFASRKMRGAPIRELPPADPPAPVKPIEIAPVSATPAIVDVPQEQPSKRPHPKYVFNVVFTQQQTGEERIEQVQLGPDEIAETSLDGLGATGPRGREIALRLATARVPAEFMFAGKPNSISLDLTRLINSMNAD